MELVNKHLTLISEEKVRNFVHGAWREGEEIQCRESEVEQLLIAMQKNPDEDDDDNMEPDVVIERDPNPDLYWQYMRSVACGNGVEESEGED